MTQENAESSNSIDINNNNINNSNNVNELNESNKTKANVARWSIESNDNSCNDKARSFHLISLNLNCLSSEKELGRAEESFKSAVKESIESLNKILETTGKLKG